MEEWTEHIANYTAESKSLGLEFKITPYYKDKGFAKDYVRLDLQGHIGNNLWILWNKEYNTVEEAKAGLEGILPRIRKVVNAWGEL